MSTLNEERLAVAEELLVYAQTRYNDGGWDVLVECWTAQMIVDHWVKNHREWDDPIPTLLTEAVDSFKGFVEIWDDRQADAKNSEF